MKIVILTNWFSEKMGYIENCLPKALAYLGHEVHVVASTAQIYFNDPMYKESYENFLGTNIVDECVKPFEGYTLHRLPFFTINGKIVIKSLHSKLKEINPDVVQTFDPVSFINLQVIYSMLTLKFKFFTANHTAASVFPLYTEKRSLLYKIGFYFSRTLLAKFQNLFISRSYPATIDCEDVAIKFYGLSKEKSKMLPLGVDTQCFYPITSEQERLECLELRKELGYTENDIVCIYTGRFTKGKNPLCLAKAIEKLVETGEPYKGLFFGDGEQLEELKKTKGCIVKEFVPFQLLVKYYRLADIGVWPTQESTSMLDAAACGLPIVISNRVKAVERVEGNGKTYIESDPNDLSKVLLSLKDKSIRNELGNAGIKKIADNYSWIKMAKDRVEDYKLFVNI